MFNDLGTKESNFCIQRLDLFSAPKSIPLELMNQLKLGGRMIIPVGDSVQQQLKVIERKEEEFQSNVVDDVMFVPLQEGIVS